MGLKEQNLEYFQLEDANYRAVKELDYTAACN